jgi:(E)-4-hydroxy-3-methylbut-2-enyl-diphosphate synthase
MNMIERRKTRTVKVGNVMIGGNNPITIQSMTNTKTSDVRATVSQINRLAEAGCEIIRVAVPDPGSSEAISAIKKEIGIPIVADIHYDYRLAVSSIKNGADKVRINPGNIGGKKNLKEVVEAAKYYSVPIRIGINCGSLEKDILEQYGAIDEFAVLQSVDRSIGIMDELDFHDLVISVKSSDVMLNYRVNMLISKKYDFPVHLGITESGADTAGIVKSSVGIGLLLNEGIGDTIRVSLSSDPADEVYAALRILNSLDIRKTGIDIISCPTCARTSVDVIGIARRVKEETADIKKYIKVAVMGCAVNGVGEAKEADIGIAGGNNEFLLFMKGKILYKINEERAVEELINHIKRIAENAEEIM